MSMARGILAAVLSGLALQAEAQAPARVAIVSPVTEAQGATRLTAFKDGMRDNGLIEGRHYVFDAVYAEGKPDRYPALIQEVLQRNPAVIVVVAIPSVRAAQQATKTIPIVFIATNDPVGNGLVASLARPGGNTTGLTGQGEDLVAKHVELLHHAVPGATRLAVLTNAATNPAHVKMFETASAAAAGFGMSARAFEAASPSALDAALEAVANYRADALLVLLNAPHYGERARISAFGLKNGIAIITPESEFADAGSLIAYSTPYTPLFRHAAGYVKKILAGAKPADLPVEQPTKFELVINAKTAKALGLTIPQSVLLRADRVIE